MTTQAKQSLWNHYTIERFPILVAHSGPWEIRSDESGEYCAAIPRDKNSGHLPSGYGDIGYVGRMVRDGHLVTAAKPWPKVGV